jgi:anti-sigma factor RsiW
MRCQDIERLILEEGERALSPEERAAVEAHLAVCAGCERFSVFWRDLAVRLDRGRAPELTPDLAEKVRAAAHAEIYSRLGERTGRAARTSSAPVPALIWAALAVITVLTVGFLLPGIEEFLQNPRLSFETALVLILLLQNALTLFFAPVLMRRRQYS